VFWIIALVNLSLDVADYILISPTSREEGASAVVHVLLASPVENQLLWASLVFHILCFLDYVVRLFMPDLSVVDRTARWVRTWR